MQDQQLSQVPAGAEPDIEATKYLEVKAKSMINQVNSPDLFMDYSLNPYQGCEHGCAYCYARPTHPYWGYSAGDEFETRVLVKTNAVEVLKKELCARSYQVKPIMLSGNTDCYQPAEKKFQLTRRILQLMLDWRHPVMIITKNALIKRDLDILEELNNWNLVRIAISLTAASDQTRRLMEPRASSIGTRLDAIQHLSQKNIPVHAMMAPIIPSINDHEIFDMVRLAGEAGASSASWQIVRLNGEVQTVFENWLLSNYPDRTDRVLNQIRSCHGGQLSDSRFGTRMKGEGLTASLISQQFKLALNRFLPKKEFPPLRTDLFRPSKSGMRELFD